MHTELPPIGKISPEIFDELIFPRLGAPSKQILVGPQHGVDIGVVDIGNGQVMAMTCDPVFVVPTYGFQRAAWFAIHILASDAAVSALRPTYMCIDLNLPPDITRDQLAVLWTSMHETCAAIGISIVSGHTARYDGCAYPMVGGATVISIGPRDNYVTPAMARIGDIVIVTKGAAIEAAGLLAATFPDRLAAAFGEPFAREADTLFYQMSVVDDALTAASVGVRDNGVTAMHDATECGVWGGLYEIAHASGVGMRIEQDRIIVRDDVRRICDLFELDPYAAISEGTLLLTCRPQHADAVLAALAAKAIPASAVGEITPRAHGLTVVTGGKERPLEHPRVDPFWGAFGRAMAEGQDAAQS